MYIHYILTYPATFFKGIFHFVLDKKEKKLYNCSVANIGVWLSLARAPALGAGRRRFESCHPDQLYVTK